MTTQAEVRKSFWENHPQFKKEYKRADVKRALLPTLVRYVEKRQNDYCTDIRCAFVDYVEYLHRDGIISDKLANNVTL
jgi:hypothetical protein